MNMWVYVEKSKKNTEHGVLLGLEPISLVIMKGRLWLSGHVECKDDGNLVK